MNEQKPASLYWVQLLPLVAVVLFATACGNAGGVDGNSVGDFWAGRRTDIYLKSFEDSTQNANVSATITQWSPYVNGNINANIPISQQLIFADVRAHLIIANGVSARLETIQVTFTEIDGSDVLDYRVVPPVSVAGRFDFQIPVNLALQASPITSLGAPLGEPTGNPTDFFVPVNLFNTEIFWFQYGQPAQNVRPLLARITFKGRDILDNPYTLVSHLLMSQMILIKSSSG